MEGVAVYTFLFTDIEGSTRRWEVDPEGMELALEAHDAVLRDAIETSGGRLFKHTGDGVCARFDSSNAAIEAAIEAQHHLRLPVRMGIATGEAHERDGDYFGAVLNRTARVMSAGHGGQILVAESSAVSISGVELVDLGERRLRDLTDMTRLYQVRADGLVAEFPPLRTVDLSPGNLPAPETSFLGRELEVKNMTELLRHHRLVTLTGSGGVGKTRISLQVAAELVTEFPDGVWFVELAPVGGPDAVPDAVARVLNVARQADVSLTAGIAHAVGGRRMLLVLDNCEHLLNGVADLVDVILSSTPMAKVLVTSREGLRVRSEHLWPVPPLDVADGLHSPAAELLLDRAKAVDPSFSLRDAADVEAAVEICQRLDGLPLAIELAAARLMSMSVQEVRDRLDHRFRLLTGPSRGHAHLQTLGMALQWSYDLLTQKEQTLLDRCSVFAGGFDLDATTNVCGTPDADEYEALDTLDSLVRKSLLAVDRVGATTFYRMLETVRQFSQERLRSNDLANLRDRHARYFAGKARTYWEDKWNGAQYREAVDWVDENFDNLRAAFSWAAERGDVESAATIASHSTALAFALQRYEPIEWAEDILPAAAGADIAQLPRVYGAASMCTYVGRPEDAVAYAQRALALEADPRYDGFERGWTPFWEAIAHRFAGRAERYVAICAEMAQQSGLAQLIGRCALIFALPLIGRSKEAMALADDTVGAARARHNPFLIAYALNAYGRAFTEEQPERALQALRDGLAYAREHRVPFWEANIARDAAPLVAAHGERGEALSMFEETINSFHRSGNVGHAAATVANLAVFFARIEQPEIAATIYGACRRHASINMVIGLAAVVDNLQSTLGEVQFDVCVERGAALDWGEAIGYSLRQIYAIRQPHKPRMSAAGLPDG